MQSSCDPEICETNVRALLVRFRFNTAVDLAVFHPFGYCELLINKKFQVIRRLVTDDEPGQRGHDARSAR